MYTRRLRFASLPLLFVCLHLAAEQAGDDEGPGQPPHEAPTPVSEAKRRALEKRASALRELYDQLLLKGETDERLMATIREVAAAREAGDWARVEQALTAYERPVVETGLPASTGAPASPAAAGITELTVEERKVSYRSGDLLLTAIVMVPRAPGKEPPFPGVLLVHNNFLGSGLTERSLARAVAEKYYIVMIAELRGYGRNPGQPEYALAEVEDTVAALRALSALEEVDKNKKPALIGDRHGANCALLAAARLGDEAALTIAVNPYPDLAAALKRSELRGLLARLSVRLNRHDNQSLIPRSPFFNVSGITCPVRLFYGKKNVAVSEKDMQRYLAVLEARQVKAQLETFITAGEELFEQTAVIKPDVLKALEEMYRPKGRQPGRRDGRGGGDSGGRTNKPNVAHIPQIGPTTGPIHPHYFGDYSNDAEF